MNNKVYMPGEFLKNKNEFELGIGTYLANDKIYAAIKGTIDINQNIISITPTHQMDPQLKLGSLIIGQVSTIREDKAFIKILKLDGIKVNNYMEGVLRKQNVRQHEIDKVEMNKCYIPGDIIKAKLISYGDSQKMYISTAEDDLGVLFAKHSESNQLMIPLSWDEMTCVQSGLKEKRKVAKPNFDRLM